MNNEFNIGVFIANKSVQPVISNTTNRTVGRRSADRSVKGHHFKPTMHLKALGEKIKTLHRVGMRGVANER